MMRKVLSIAMVLLTILFVNAQQPQWTPLPLNPNVKSGKLSNGLEYFILHNEEPKNRANFYIAQKVGSTLETETQLGLAHFLEHMAFNGTKNFPGKALLNYLQDKGIRFGSDINAYTGFDETVYNINNVPTTDKNLLDSCLLALHDWSCAIELLDAEIDAERGVIREEWRQRNDANFRMYSAVLPQIYKEYQYHQMPIGKMEVVENFKYNELRDYYHKWYRPDQQGIVIVGDFDVNEMEQKVKTLFSQIPMPKNAAKRTYPEVSKNKEPIFAFYQDPELQQTTVRIAFKEDATPRELRSTVENYLYGPVMEWVISSLINNRLSEFATTAECDYVNAATYFGNFWISNTLKSFNVFVMPKSGDVQKATEQAMGIIARACKTGFTDSELARVRDEILSQYERQYNERDKTNNDNLATEIIRYFIDNEPTPGIETEYQIITQVLPSLPVQAVNELAAQILTPDNQVIVVAQPQKDDIKVVAKGDMIAVVDNALKADYEPYVDEVITEPLIAQLPKPGSITNIKENPVIGGTEITLSNGVKVVVKSTDFSNDQILFEAYREGGKRTYPMDQAANVNLSSIAFNVSKWGPFNLTTLRKYLAGKNVGLDFGIKNYTDIFEGSSSVKDLPTFMELLYTAFTNINPDEELYKTTVASLRSQMAMLDKNPEYNFQKRVEAATYGDNPMMATEDLKMIDAANYLQMVDMIKKATANAADYTFIFVGNVDVATLRPLLEQYVATLPVARRKKVQDVTDIKPRSGKISDKFDFVSEVPSVYVQDIWSGTNLEYNLKNSIYLSVCSEVLNMIYTETLREEEGGTYGAGVFGSINPNTGIWEMNVEFQTNAEQAQTLIDRAEKEFKGLLANGADNEKFSRVKGNLLKQHEQSIRNNGRWLNNIFTYLRGWNMISGWEETVQNMTLADFNNWMKTLYNGQNEIEVVMNAAPAK